METVNDELKNICQVKHTAIGVLPALF
ncbi:MAG: hypothetical protein H7254_00120 [Ferruginibacter sp.]|nr:hypothetical protein [Ferruginibacter sp.]